MVIGTLNGTYEKNAAVMFLKQIGKNNVEKVMDNLLSRNVLSKLARQPNRAIPGRTLKYRKRK